MSTPTIFVGAPIALHFAQRFASLAQNLGRGNLKSNKQGYLAETLDATDGCASIIMCNAEKI
ncbi:hypothetical protein [Ruegeria faecimaris]|uniref:hypothetical protein n=1 Tax=Ruegeria faecimaris TaxID=686389 RepID=UPI0023310EFF|nr:hypothetical protein [Ruegeria faecimaris]